MITDSGTHLFQRPTHPNRLRWSRILLMPVTFFVLTSRVEAQQVRLIQAPAPYNGCNLRSGGGTQYSVSGVFRNGTSATLLGEFGGGWYRVQVPQQVGWLARQCLGL